MLISSLCVLVAVGFGFAANDLDCNTVTAGEGPEQVCTKTVTPPRQLCGDSVVTTTITVTTAISPEPKSTNLECGTVAPQGAPRELGEARLGEVPWHAAVYSKAFTPYRQICEGAVVSATVVLSAAHCFYNVTREARLVPRQPPARYAVAVGKLAQQWDAAEDLHAQKFNVREIHIPERFLGSVTNFQADLAVVKMASAIVFNGVVRPVCLDFDYRLEKSQLTSGNLGKIASWSIPSSEPGALQMLELPYVAPAQCFEQAPRAFLPYVTADKLCAFGTDSSSVLCRGGAGSGLVFAQEQHGVTRYFLRGLSSASGVAREDGCSHHLSFTSLASHRQFLQELLSSTI